MREIIVGLLLVCAIEGLLLAGFPEGMRKAMEETSKVSARHLRLAGFVFAVLGVGGLWALKRFGSF